MTSRNESAILKKVILRMTRKTMMGKHCSFCLQREASWLKTSCGKDQRYRPGVRVNHPVLDIKRDVSAALQALLLSDGWNGAFRS